MAHQQIATQKHAEYKEQVAALEKDAFNEHAIGCNECRVNFKSYAFLQRHMGQFHNEFSRLQCPTCLSCTAHNEAILLGAMKRAGCYNHRRCAYCSVVFSESPGEQIPVFAKMRQHYIDEHSDQPLVADPAPDSGWAFLNRFRRR